MEFNGLYYTLAATPRLQPYQSLQRIMVSLYFNPMAQHSTQRNHISEAYEFPVPVTKSWFDFKVDYRIVI
jgi:hypothetical protein